MKQIVNQIKNYIQLHTSEIEDYDYINLMRELAEWANSQADITEYSDDTETVFPTHE